MKLAITVGLLCLAPFCFAADVVAKVVFPANTTCVDLAVAANELIAKGEPGAVIELVNRWKDGNRDFGQRIQIGWMCRLIFVPKYNQNLRPPALGGGWLEPVVEDGSLTENWPYYPLAEAEGVFFVLSRSYILAGTPEDPIAYLSYCRANGMFRRELLPIPTHAAAHKAMIAILKRIRGYTHADIPAERLEGFREQVGEQANKTAEPASSNQVGSP